MSNLNLDFTVDANRDLRATLRYTRRIWGDQQRSIYAQRLTETFERLMTHPFLGRDLAHIQLGLRAQPVGPHVIYYRVEADTIVVIRILHEKMDASIHLRP